MYKISISQLRILVIGGIILSVVFFYRSSANYDDGVNGTLPLVLGILTSGFTVFYYIGWKDSNKKSINRPLSINIPPAEEPNMDLIESDKAHPTNLPTKEISQAERAKTIQQNRDMRKGTIILGVIIVFIVLISLLANL